jgi:CheY-like chemotaxis protein
MLGGEIRVSSREGEGSVFVVTLPLEVEGRVAPAVETEIPLTDPGRTALVIDADPGSLYLTKKYLTEEGYSVAATDDPARGIEIAAKARPAVVTVDLDALEGDPGLIERLLNSHPEAMIVVFSADGGAEAGALGAGAKVFLRKPVDRSSLVAVLERAKSPLQKCVLVVDDDPDALELAVTMIEGGLRTLTAITPRSIGCPCPAAPRRDRSRLDAAGNGWLRGRASDESESRLAKHSRDPLDGARSVT